MTRPMMSLTVSNVSRRQPMQREKEKKTFLI